MRVIVVGCGRVGSTLAYQLFKNGNQVTVIDQDETAFDNLANDFQGRFIIGDVLARNVLHRAEIEETEALAAVTNSDSLNALIAHVARTEYNIPRVVARNYDPRQLPLQVAFDIPVVGSATWGAQRMEEMITDDPLHTVLTDDESDLHIYYFAVPESWNGHSSLDLVPREHFTLISWTRAGKPLPISMIQSLETGDVIYLTGDTSGIQELRGKLANRKEGTV